MEERIIVRTLVNVSYAGKAFHSNIFSGKGIVLQPNKNMEMLVFIPENEIREIICNAVSMSFQEYISRKEG